jgi:hypothetical protein
MAKPGSLREVMPWTASIIDEWREAFGIEAVNQIIAAGTAGKPGFHATENGVEIGTPMQWDADRAVKVGDMVLGQPNVKQPRKGG